MYIYIYINVCVCIYIYSSASTAACATILRYHTVHSGGNHRANRRSISHRCCLKEVVFEWELTKKNLFAHGLSPRWWSSTLSPIINLPSVVYLRALCGADLVTYPSNVAGNDPLVRHRVGAAFASAGDLTNETMPEIDGSAPSYSRVANLSSVPVVNR